MGFWTALMIVSIVGIIAGSIVTIVQLGSSSGGKGMRQKIGALEQHLNELEAELEDARNRVVVLERIVTDDKSDLSRQIDDLAGG